MKRLKILPLVIMGLSISLTTLYSCSNDESNISSSGENTVLNSSPLARINKSTNLVSDLSFNLGAYEMDVTNNIYSFKTKKGFVFNKYYYDLANFKFKIEENKLILIDNEKYSLSLDDSLFFTTPSFKGELNIGNVDFQNDINVLVLRIARHDILEEGIMETFDNKLPPMSQTGTCSFWNTYYCVGVGGNQSAAIANMNYEIQDSLNSGELTNCQQLGQAEPVSLTGGLAWATAYCCR